MTIACAAGRATDRLSGGFGADSLDGEAGDDFARGDATIDRIGDSGGGTDTLSFATGVTPGFPNQGSFFDNAGFPPDVGRGVYVDLGSDFANDGLAPSGGGVDEPLAPDTTFGNFETVIGTPFDDYIVGTVGCRDLLRGRRRRPDRRRRGRRRRLRRRRGRRLHGPDQPRMRVRRRRKSSRGIPARSPPG